MDEEEALAIVIDNGSGLIKAGLAGYKTPNVVFPSIVGRPRRSFYIGEEAKNTQVPLNLNRPIRRGLINEWDEMEVMWDYTFRHELRLYSEDHPVLLTEAPLNPRFNREKTTEIMFEKFKTPLLCLSNPAVLSLYASGRQEGMIIDSGDGTTHIVPVCQGYAVKNNIFRLDIAGTDLTKSLYQMLNQRGYELNDINVIEKIKEKVCYVALDFDQELASARTSSVIEKSYELPDGKIIKVNSERFRVAELLLKTNYSDIPSIPEACFHSIMKFELNIRSNLWSNIILSGGTTMLPGLEDRLEYEISRMAPKNIKAKVYAPPERMLSSWIGGSVLATLPSFKNMCISRREYDEYGPMIVHNRCF